MLQSLLYLVNNFRVFLSYLLERPGNVGLVLLFSKPTNRFSYGWGKSVLQNNETNANVFESFNKHKTQR